MIGLPLKDENAKAFGVLAIYSSEVNAFTQEEVRLLEELAGDLAFGIMVLRARVERDQAEQALHQSQERYRAFFEQNLAGNYISDPAGNLLACNAAFLRMFGFASNEEARRTNLLSLYQSPEKRAEFLGELRLLGHVERYEKELRRKDGGTVFVIENAIAILDSRGELAEIHGFLIDETESRKAEQQLRQAQKMEAVGRLAGGVAHDFNNILGVINGYSEILLGNQKVDDTVRRRIQEIFKAGQRAAALTRQLLAFSRRQVLQPKLISLNLVIEDMDKMLERLIGEDIEVQTILDPNLDAVKADPGQMEQVILNFCINARDAMPEGGSLTIETKNVDVDELQAAPHFPVKAGRYVRLNVSDTGAGMDKETMSHVFEPFFTTKGPEKGTGLGLATVYGIVEQSGGHVCVYSEPGQGSTFSVYLPAAVAQEQPQELVSKPAELARGTETILLVEDAAPLRAMTRELLENGGYTVLEAADGHQAMRICEEFDGNISLLVTDVVLPKIQGPALAQKLTEAKTGLKVLYISGYADSIVSGGVLKAGSAFLQKPFSADDLARKVREVLDAQPG